MDAYRWSQGRIKLPLGPRGLNIRPSLQVQLIQLQAKLRYRMRSVGGAKFVA